MKRWILFICGVALVAPVAVLYATKAYRSYSTQIEAPEGVNLLTPVNVNGLNNWLLIRGHDRQNPVLLFLNGGPGESLLALSHEFFSEVEKHYTVVQVETVGVGNALQDYGVGPDFGTVVAETVQIISFINETLGTDSVTILGHSYGSAVGGVVARNHPELVDQFISVGQLVDWPAGNTAAYNYLIERANAEGNYQALEELAEIRPDLAADDSHNMIAFEYVVVQRKWLEYFGLFKVLRDHTAGKRWFAYLTSPHHDLRSSCRIAGAEIFFCPWIAEKDWWQNWQNVIPGIIQFDANEDLSELKMPVTAIVGSVDWVTPTPMIKDYMGRLDAPNKNVVEIKGAGHYTFLDDPQAFQAAVINTRPNVAE